MADHQNESGIRSGRLEPHEYQENFADLHPPLDRHEASVEADRCYFCYDAPCMTACPTSIDIPQFIRQISTGNANGAAKTIFDQNILGGMCARVCPTETLCEQVCVRETSEGKPVKIGLLQRFATDSFMSDKKQQPYDRAKESGKHVAVVGGGPAGLACAHRLSMHGHDVTIFEARAKSGGLNEFGIAAYKSVDDFAQAEVDFVLGIGGITVETGKALGRDMTLADLQAKYDAVFIGTGLAGVNALRAEGENLAGVADAVSYIADLRQAEDLSGLPVGRNIAVIGGGMTAIDIAVQTKRLGAENVTLLYRRGPEQMGASAYEQQLAQTSGVTIRHWVMPIAVHGENGAANAIELEYSRLEDGKLAGTGERFSLEVDQVFKAIGQTFDESAIRSGSSVPELKGGRILVDTDRKTSLENVWAGGDCIFGGEDLTVASVDDGRTAAESIHQYLSA